MKLGILNKISNDLDELLLPCTIDLSIFRDISDADVAEQIQRVGKTFYARTGTTSPPFLEKGFSPPL